VKRSAHSLIKKHPIRKRQPFPVNTNALQQKLPSITLILLVPAMIAALSFQAYTIFAPANNESSNTIQAVKQTTTKTQPTRDIKKYKLFGTPTSANTQQTVAKTENLPKTNLRLVLRGVSASASSDGDKTASALIEGPNKETLKYSINSALPGNAKLRSVYEKRIVIERNGRLENLYFPDSKSIGIVSSAASTSSSPQQNQSAPATPPKQSTIPQARVPQNFSRPASNLDTLSDQRKEEIKQRLLQLREKMKQSQ